MRPRSDAGEGRATAGGVDEAFARLVRAEQRRVYHFLLKRVGHPDDAAELAQDVFLQAYRGWDRFRGESKASTWLFGIALNLARQHVSRSPAKRWPHLSDTVLESVSSGTDDPEREASHRSMVRRLAAATEHLLPEMRDVFSLVCLEGMAYDQAAEILGIPIGTVRSRVARARAALRQALEDPDDVNTVAEDPARVG